MCSFLSALILRNGDIVMDPEHTDSHEVLIASLGLQDTGETIAGRSFVRVEFTPGDDIAAISDLSTWRLRIDEESSPDWVDLDLIRSKLEDRIRRMFVTDHRLLLLGGCWILTGSAVVDKIVSARIVLMSDSSRIGKMSGSSRIGKMSGSSRIGEMLDSSRIVEMWDSSRIVEMWDSSQVGKMWGSSRIGKMSGSSRIVDNPTTPKEK